ncbi:hypothetical protein EVAR_69695_1, partial [Eumeta japonica]
MVGCTVFELLPKNCASQQKERVKLRASYVVTNSVTRLVSDLQIISGQLGLHTARALPSEIEECEKAYPSSCSE